MFVWWLLIIVYVMSSDRVVSGIDNDSPPVAFWTTLFVFPVCQTLDRLGHNCFPLPLWLPDYLRNSQYVHLGVVPFIRNAKTALKAKGNCDLIFKKIKRKQAGRTEMWLCERREVMTNFYMATVPILFPDDCVPKMAVSVEDRFRTPFERAISRDFHFDCL